MSIEFDEADVKKLIGDLSVPLYKSVAQQLLQKNGKTPLEFAYEKAQEGLVTDTATILSLATGMPDEALADILAIALDNGSKREQLLVEGFSKFPKLQVDNLIRQMSMSSMAKGLRERYKIQP